MDVAVDVVRGITPDEPAVAATANGAVQLERLPDEHIGGVEAELVVHLHVFDDGCRLVREPVGPVRRVQVGDREFDLRGVLGEGDAHLHLVLHGIVVAVRVVEVFLAVTVVVDAVVAVLDLVGADVVVGVVAVLVVQHPAAGAAVALGRVLGVAVAIAVGVPVADHHVGVLRALRVGLVDVAVTVVVDAVVADLVGVRVDVVVGVIAVVVIAHPAAGAALALGRVVRVTEVVAVSVPEAHDHVVVLGALAVVAVHVAVAIVVDFVVAEVVDLLDVRVDVVVGVIAVAAVLDEAVGALARNDLDGLAEAVAVAVRIGPALDGLAIGASLGVRVGVRVGIGVAVCIRVRIGIGICVGVRVRLPGGRSHRGGPCLDTVIDCPAAAAAERERGHEDEEEKHLSHGSSRTVEVVLNASILPDLWPCGS